ncbi:MAG TPA: AbrB/MazE/SpoVT family DNA-binding domain-containing protein [Candidatus Nanoarchaeia archaeon]|nr:AbrB/MazE/SpoVT family DNA-binding domain-containing protein [Candidatus Nanoarchaeia archaeon]
MKRKVIQIADSTQLVSLPRKWAQAHGIKKGDELDVQEEGPKIIVSTEDGAAIRRCEINLDKLDPIIPRVMHGLYKKGVDEVTLHFSNPQFLDPVQKILREDLVGYEIVQQERNTCLIKAIAGASQEEFDNMLRRTFVVLDSMANGVYESMVSGDSSNMTNIRFLETNNNKYTGFCRRLINKKGYSDYQNLTFMYCTVEELEKLADQYKYLCDYFIQNPKKIKSIDKSIMGVYRQLTEMVKQMHTLFYKYDIESAVSIFRLRRQLVEQVLKTLGKSHDASLSHYAINMIQLVANLVSFKMQMEL